MQPRRVYHWEYADCGDCISVFGLVSLQSPGPWVCPPKSPIYTTTSHGKKKNKTKQQTNIPPNPSILHFTLFTLACIDTRKWRKTSTRTKDHRSNSDSNSNDDDAMQLPYQPHHDAEHACPPAYTPQGQEVASKDESSVEERPVGGT